MARAPWTVRQDGEWTILHVRAGGAETTSSLTQKEAVSLAALLVRPSEAREHPAEGHVYKRREDGSHWSFEGFWRHPQHQPYHVNWTGEYAIVQVYGNFKNELQFIPLPDWDELFELAWEPLKVCAFCGFSRMRPCLKRQTCANLTDYRLEPDEPTESEDAA